MSKEERLRRVRLGELQRLLQDSYHRRGHRHLPDDDAGREDLFELLLPISLGDGAERKMKIQIGLWAPWMSADEARQLIDNINRIPEYQRKVTARKLGERMGLTNEKRERLGIRTIAPIDMTAEQMAEQRKAKDRARKERRRRKAGSKPREAYIANSLTKKKPWEAEGISRAKWYRNQKKRRETGPSPIKLSNAQEQLVSLSNLRGRKELAMEAGVSVSKTVSRKRARG